MCTAPVTPYIQARNPLPPPPAHNLAAAGRYLSGMVAVMYKSGGGHGLAHVIAKGAKTRRSTQFVVLTMSLCMFFDGGWHAAPSRGARWHAGGMEYVGGGG